MDNFFLLRFWNLCMHWLLLVHLRLFKYSQSYDRACTASNKRPLIADSKSNKLVFLRNLCYRMILWPLGQWVSLSFSRFFTLFCTKSALFFYRYYCSFVDRYRVIFGRCNNLFPLFYESSLKVRADQSIDGLNCVINCFSFAMSFNRNSTWPFELNQSKWMIFLLVEAMKNYLPFMVQENSW